MMKQLALFLGTCLALCSCQSYEAVMIDYMTPAKTTFPTQYKRVGVVNNIRPNNNDSTSYLHGNPMATANAFAEALADANYFEEVVICDSMLRKNDLSQRTTPLTSAEVTQLIDELDVDFIIAIENILFDLTQKVLPRPDLNCYQSTADMKAYSFINGYADKRSEPFVHLVACDSVFWEGYGMTEVAAMNNMPPVTTLIKEGSEFIGTITAAQLLPTWKQANRLLFTSGSIALRDGAFYVQTNNWQAAYELWENEYNRAKSKKIRMRCANNIAIYFEMNDDIDQSIEWLERTTELAAQIEKIDDDTAKNINRQVSSYYTYFIFYAQELAKRKEDLPMLILQMKRHNNVF